MKDIESRIDRMAASAYLAKHWGIKRTASSLSRLASVGGGPMYLTIGRRVVYPTEELDKWAQSIISPLKEKASKVTK